MIDRDLTHLPIAPPPFERNAFDLARGEDIWVFGYGSLIWRPGFEHKAVRDAMLYGYRRALCILSHVHRGTRERPGLVLGLDRGGSCHGCAYLVDARGADAVLEYLWTREMVTGVYSPRILTVRLLEEGRVRGTKSPGPKSRGSGVRAVCFVARRDHAQYCRELDIDVAARVVAGAVGKSGRNDEYLENTAAHLREKGAPDRKLERLIAKIKAPENDSDKPLHIGGGDVGSKARRSIPKAGS